MKVGRLKDLLRNLPNGLEIVDGDGEPIVHVGQIKIVEGEGEAKRKVALFNADQWGSFS